MVWLTPLLQVLGKGLEALSQPVAERPGRVVSPRPRWAHRAPPQLALGSRCGNHGAVAGCAQASVCSQWPRQRWRPACIPSVRSQWPRQRRRPACTPDVRAKADSRRGRLPGTPTEPPREGATKAEQQRAALVIIMVIFSPGELLRNKQWEPSVTLIALVLSKTSSDWELQARGSVTVLFQRKATPRRPRAQPLVVCSALLCLCDLDVSKAVDLIFVTAQ